MTTTETITARSVPESKAGMPLAAVNPSVPLISVIVPAYNAEETLRECVESVLGQSIADFEVIIVNDGSVDSTAELALELAASDPRLHVINQANLGVSAARNRGLLVARGQYVCVLDADDIWVPDKLETQLEALGDEPDMIVIGGLRRFVDTESGRQWLTETMPPDCQDRDACLSSVMHLPSAAMNLIGTMLAPRNHLLDIGGWNERLRTGEDWDVWLRLSGRVRFKALNKTLMYYRKHAASATRGHDLLWVLEQHLSILDACGAQRPPVSRSTVNSAKLKRMLEATGNLIYSKRRLEAARVLMRSARYGCVWTTRQFYVRVTELFVTSIKSLSG